jgi:hypothetical protein
MVLISEIKLNISIQKQVKKHNDNTGLNELNNVFNINC